MTISGSVPRFLLSDGARGLPSARSSPAQRLLLIADHALVQVFRQELRRCLDCTISLDAYPSLEEAEQAEPSAYDWVAVDLNGAVAPSEAVRLARQAWPDARLAVLSLCWSERDTAARDLADTVIHKPLRSVELQAFLRIAGDPRVEQVASEPVPVRRSS